MSLALVLSLALAQAPEADAKPVPPVDPPAVQPSRDRREVLIIRDAAAAGEASAPPPAQTPWWQRLTLTGFARVGVFYTVPPTEEALVGSNGGFRVADFRLGFEFHPVERFTAVASVELAAPVVEASDPLTGHRAVEVRDAFVQYDAARFLQVRAGQFRPGYFAEMLLSDGAIPFVSRSVLSGGLAPPEGYGPRGALAPDRQIGVQVGSARLGGEGLGFKYAVGAFNGNGQNQLFNDNNAVMPVARVEADWSQKVTLGLNASWNQRSEGVRPNRLLTTQLNFGADVQVQAGGLSALAGVLGRSSSFSYPGLLPELALGGLGQVRYQHAATGLEGAVRGAWLEPSSAQSDDQVLEVAAMIGWRPFEMPFRVLLQYTHRSEEPAVSFGNDSVDAMLHAVW